MWRSYEMRDPAASMAPNDGTERSVTDSKRGLIGLGSWSGRRSPSALAEIELCPPWDAEACASLPQEALARVRGRNVAVTLQ